MPPQPQSPSPSPSPRACNIVTELFAQHCGQHTRHQAEIQVAADASRALITQAQEKYKEAMKARDAYMQIMKDAEQEERDACYATLCLSALDERCILGEMVHEANHLARKLYFSRARTMYLHLLGTRNNQEAILGLAMMELTGMKNDSLYQDFAREMNADIDQADAFAAHLTKPELVEQYTTTRAVWAQRVSKKLSM